MRAVRNVFENVNFTPEHRQRILRALSRAMRQRSVRWGLGAFVLVNTLLLILLTLTEQLHWLPFLWPLTVTRVLFQVFFATSLIDVALVGLTGIGSAVYLWRRREIDPRANLMTLMRRALIVPCLYLLSAFWSWAWLTDHSPRLFGTALMALWGGSYLVHFLYFTFRAFDHSHAAADNQGTDAQSAGNGRRLIHALWVLVRARVQKGQRAYHRKWWLLTHRNYIKRLPAPDRALFQSVVGGVTQNVEVLLKRGADPNLRLLYGMPLITFCASLGRTEAVRALLDAGADINAATPPTGFNALLNASDKGNLALVRLLVERGADTEARISSGATPLMLAARNGHAEVATFMLNNGANADAANKKGATALVFTANSGQVEAARILLDAGANPSLKTASGRTALDCARKKGYQELIEILSKAQTRKEQDHL